MELDSKNGFKDFTFGDPKSDFKFLSSIPPLSSDDISESYLYLKEEPNSLFGVEWLLMGMTFYNDRLGKITIQWMYDEEVYTKLLSNLSIIFGKPYEMDASEMEKGNLFLYDHWEGTKVAMSLRRHDPSTVSYVNDRITLVILNKEIC